MNMTEVMRLITALKAMGLTDEEIIRFIQWIESGDEQYMPTRK